MMSESNLSDAENAPYLYLTTTGRKSGLPREIEIWFVAHGGHYYLVAEHRERAQWVQNIQADPAITFRLADRERGPAFAGKGRVVSRDAEPELAASVSALMDAKYDWSDGLIVELAPERAIP
jgi:deazaflavin-dependent oxidoreductase (nitroreductase family)